MVEPIWTAVTLLAGFGLGLIFFGGLWITLRALPGSRNPGVMMLASFWVRTALAGAGFVLVIDHRWQRAVASLLGFLIARLVLTRWIPQGPQSERPAE
jgi:F1F0 ATPase subunit 2